MRQQFFRFAPLLLGIAGAILGLSGFALDQILDFDDDWLLWTIAALTQAVGGIYIGHLLRKLHQAATTDQLTGLNNRRYGHLKVTEELKRSNLVLSIAMVDIDNFKTVNDIYGHLSGDALLVELADLIKKTVRHTDVVIRWGGDEFLVIFPQTDKEEAAAIAERLREATEDIYSREQLTLSIGVTTVSSAADLHQALEKVDTVLYRAKGQKNAVVCF